MNVKDKCGWLLFCCLLSPPRTEAGAAEASGPSTSSNTDSTNTTENSSQETPAQSRELWISRSYHHSLVWLIVKELVES